MTFDNFIFDMCNKSSDFFYITSRFIKKKIEIAKYILAYDKKLVFLKYEKMLPNITTKIEIHFPRI